MKGVLIASIIIMCLLVLYAVIELIEHKCIMTTRRFLNLGLNMRVLIISDLHNYHVSENTFLKMAAEKPNYIFLAGDMINHETKNPANAISVIKRLSKIADVYYSLGNHEVKFRDKYPEKWEVYIKSLPANCIILDNAHVHLGNKAELYGITLPRYFYHKGKRYDYSNDAPMHIEPLVEGRKNITITHAPGFLPFYDSIVKSDCIIAGHLHGGMVRLPFIGGLVYFTQGDKKYDCGIYENRMVVSRGLGNHFIPARFNNRCEFIILNL